MKPSVKLLLLCFTPGYCWTTALNTDLSLPHFFDIQISSHVSRLNFQSATAKLDELQTQLLSLNSTNVLNTGEVYI